MLAVKRRQLVAQHENLKLVALSTTEQQRSESQDASHRM
jgi:hypothetical protein